MIRLLTVLLVLGFAAPSATSAPPKKKVKPDISESKEYPGVFLSPSAKTIPSPFRSVLQMEIIVKKGESEASVIYANGIVFSKDGLIASVVDAPNATTDENGGIQSASVMVLGGDSAAAKLIKFDAAHGVAIFRAKGLEARPLALSKAPVVAKRRLMWYAVFRNGRKTCLYRRPLQVHKGTHAVGETKDLCLIIDDGAHTSLNADRSGSALIGLDGGVIALMGRLKHWNITPKGVTPRTKTAWAVPASVIAQLIKDAK